MAVSIWSAVIRPDVACIFGLTSQSQAGLRLDARPPRRLIQNYARGTGQRPMGMLCHAELEIPSSALRGGQAAFRYPTLLDNLHAHVSEALEA